MMKLTINLFTLSIISLLVGCMHHYSSENNYPLQVEISAIKKANLIIFLMSNKYENLEKHYVKSFRVERSRELCDEVKQLPPYLKWHFYSEYPEKGKFISAAKGVFYKNGNNSINTIYTVKAVISKVGTLRKGHGVGVFAILPSGRILTASTYQGIQKICSQVK